MGQLQASSVEPARKMAMIKAAAVLSWMAGLGFGLPGAYGAYYFEKNNELWTFLGFPTYGNGPFERIGLATTTTLLISFVLVCAAEVLAGFLLWGNARSGGVLALALLPLEFFFWFGFALPFGPVMGISRAILVILAWSSLSK